MELTIDICSHLPTVKEGTPGVCIKLERSTISKKSIWFIMGKQYKEVLPCTCTIHSEGLREPVESHEHKPLGSDSKENIWLQVFTIVVNLLQTQIMVSFQINLVTLQLAPLCFRGAISRNSSTAAPLEKRLSGHSSVPLLKAKFCSFTGFLLLTSCLGKCFINYRKLHALQNVAAI